MPWSNLTILVTGGTGSFGKKFTETMLREYHPKKLIIFSRDELKQHEMQLDARTIGAFQFVRSDDGNKLRFQIVTSVDGAAALAEQYLRVIGAGEAQLRVNYEQQEELDIAPAEEVQESLETSEGGAPLASVTTMGGSHQKKGRK